MANVIKYSTTNPSRSSLRKGDVAIGIGKDNYGPTSATGFVSGLDVPGNGYVIYILHNNNPAAYVAYNDNDLIPIARTLGSSSTTVASAKDYIASRGDTWILNSIPQDVVTDGLIYNLDASDVSSYPTEGNTWYDISGTGINSSLINGPTFDATGIINFDGANDITSTTSNVSVSGDQSMECVFTIDTLEGFLQGIITTHNYASTANFGINQVRSNKIGISIGYTNGSREYQDKYSTTSLTTGVYYHVVMTFNLSANQCKLYIDGVLDSTFNLSKTVKFINRPLVLGRWDYNYGNYYFDGGIAQARYYDKTLSQSEVLQNYNTLLGSYQRPADSAQQIMDNNPEAESGTYWINTNLGPQLLYCILDPTVQGGGWMGVNENIAPYSGNVATTAVWEENGENLEVGNPSVLNVTVQEIGCGGTSYYQLGNPSDYGVDYTQIMMLMYRVSTIGQCSRIGGSSAYYEGPKYKGDHTSSGMCTWNNGIFANGNNSDMSGLERYWVLNASGANRDLEYSTRCASGTGTHYHMWFIK